MTVLGALVNPQTFDDYGPNVSNTIEPTDTLAIIDATFPAPVNPKTFDRC